MPTLTPTKATGATTKPSDVVYVEPGRQVTDDQLAELLPGAGVNAPFVADFLSAMLTHERCGRHLYRSVAGRTNNPMLERKYEHFGNETEEHATILEQLISEMGGNPSYVSPTARSVECMDGKALEATFMLAGSLDAMTQEMAMLDAVFVAESIDHANWKTLAELTPELPEGHLRTSFQQAVDKVEAQEDEHLGWATDMRSKMVLLQAESRMTTSVGAKAEELIEKVRGWFS